MRESDLPSPDIGGKGHHLRRLCAVVIGQLQASAGGFQYGIHPKASFLITFFQAVVTAITPLTLRIPVLVFNPTSKSYSIVAGAAQGGPALNLGGSTGAVTYSSADVTIATVNAATGAITPLAGQAGKTVTITASVAADATYRAWSAYYTATITA